MPSTFKLNLHTSVLIGCALTAASALGAEEMPTKKKEPAPAEKPQQLPEVTVTDAPPEPIGYKATRATTATKTDTPLIEMPQSISVITRDRMDAQNVQSLQDALRYTPGVTGEAFGNETRSDFLNIRGFDQRTTGLHRDGLQLNSGLGFAAFRLDPYGAERIEVLRGPASVLYGQIGPGDLVNFVSKRPTADPWREITLQAGSYDRFQGTFDLSGPANKDGTLRYRLTGLARDSDTQVDFIEDDRVFVAPALTWQPNADTSLTLLTHYQRDETGTTAQFLPASGTVFSNPNGSIPVSRFPGEPGFEGFDRTQYSAGYLFEHRLNDALMLRQNARYSHVDVDYRTVFGIGFQDDQRTLNRLSLITAPETDAYTIDNQAQVKFSTGPLAHTLLFGIDYQRYVFDNPLGFGGAPAIDVYAPVYGQAVDTPAFSVNTETVQRQLGVYLQDQIKLYDKWVLVLSGRQDWVSTDIEDRTTDTRTDQNDNAFTGRAGLVYLADSGLAPYVSYAESFAAILGTDFFGNVFEPETGKQYEVGVKYQPPRMKDAFVTLAAFDLRRQNVVTSDAAFNQFQTGEIRSRGAELEAVASLSRSVDLIAAYTYIDPEITQSASSNVVGNRPFGVPEHRASL